MENATGEKNTRPKWVAWRVWGTVLFVLSDPVMHFSLTGHEENHCRPLKTT